MRTNPDVLIAGAGPVGLFTAWLLRNAGVSVQVFDIGAWPCAHSYGLAIHPRTVDLLRRSGVAGKAFDNVCAVNTLAVYDDRNRRAELRVGRNGRPLIVLPQSTLEAELEQALAQADVHVQWRHRVMRAETAGDRARAILNRYEKESRGYVIARMDWVVADSWTAEASFVVGADGHDSAVRRSIGIRFEQTAPCAWYAVFEFRSDADVGDEVRIALGEATADVLWPLGDGWFRWSFQLPEYTDPEVDRLAGYREHFGEPTERLKDRLYGTSGEVNVLPDARLAQLAGERAPWFKGSFDDVGWRTIVRFERRLATAFGNGRCWLAGDAAHLGAPMAVQSLNAGLAEAHDLSESIVAALRGGRGLEPLHDYEKQYRAEWNRLQGLAGVIEPAANVDPWVWANRDRLLSCIPAYGSDLAALAAQIGLRVP